MSTIDQQIIKDMLVEAPPEYHVRTGQSFAHAREIQKPFGVLDDVIDWCKTNLDAEWRWQLVQPSSDLCPGRYFFYFDSERDLCAFCLRWVDQ